MAAPPIAVTQAPLLFSALGTVALRVGDNDKVRRWGSLVRGERAGAPIHDLQRALTAVGTYTAGIDGDFGNGTQLALRRFQWFVTKSGYRLRVPPGAAVAAGTVEAYAQNRLVRLTGGCDAATASELGAWGKANVRTTTRLIRVKTSRFSKITRAATFTTLGYPNASDDEVLAHEGFVAGLNTLNQAATDQKVTLRLNQTFRVQNIPPAGAVVPPATRSQHLIGRAADLNIADGATTITSAMFLNNTAPQSAQDFVKATKDAGLRWGGDFTPRTHPISTARSPRVPKTTR